MSCGLQTCKLYGCLVVKYIKNPNVVRCPPPEPPKPINLIKSNKKLKKSNYSLHKW